jgi:hypothetical protein
LQAVRAKVRASCMAPPENALQALPPVHAGHAHVIHILDSDDDDALPCAAVMATQTASSTRQGQVLPHMSISSTKAAAPEPATMQSTQPLSTAAHGPTSAAKAAQQQAFSFVAAAAPSDRPPTWNSRRGTSGKDAHLSTSRGIGHSEGTSTWHSMQSASDDGNLGDGSSEESRGGCDKGYLSEPEHGASIDAVLLRVLSVQQVYGSRRHCTCLEALKTLRTSSHSSLVFKHLDVHKRLCLACTFSIPEHRWVSLIVC